MLDSEARAPITRHHCSLFRAAAATAITDDSIVTMARIFTAINMVVQRAFMVVIIITTEAMVVKIARPEPVIFYQKTV